MNGLKRVFFYVNVMDLMMSSLIVSLIDLGIGDFSCFYRVGLWLCLENNLWLLIDVG